MPKATKTKKTERESLGKSSQASISSLSLGLSSQFKGEPQPKELQKLFSLKPQIISIPGVAPMAREHYRVRIGDRILGDFLSIDEALRFAKGGKS